MTANNEAVKGALCLYYKWSAWPVREEADYLVFTELPGRLILGNPVAGSGASRQLGFRHTKFSESQLFVLCSDLRTARSVGYTGLILRETQLQLPVTASNKSTQHTYHTLRCRGPYALIHPCIGAYARVKGETLLL